MQRFAEPPELYCAKAGVQIPTRVIEKDRADTLSFSMARPEGYRSLCSLCCSFAKENDYVAFFCLTHYTEPYRISLKQNPGFSSRISITKKAEQMLDFFRGWAGGIRTPECQDQNLVPYHLATAHRSLAVLSAAVITKVLYHIHSVLYQHGAYRLCLL